LRLFAPSLFAFFAVKFFNAKDAKSFAESAKMKIISALYGALDDLYPETIRVLKDSDK
jgi:hypothetical protein